MEQRYTIWLSGYNVSHALCAEMVGETAKAYKFKEYDSGKEYTFFLPKKACSFDKNVDGIIHLARWFALEGFLRFLFDRYGSHYNR